VLSVGNWLRDWGFYFELVRKCEALHPELKFVLINRNMPEEWMSEINQRTNLTYLSNVNDEELFSLYMKSSVQFLPVKSAAGNNALLQGLVLGCPLLMTNVVSDEFPFKGKFASFYEKDNFTNCIQEIKYFSSIAENESLIIEKSAISIAKKFDWEQIAIRTEEIYKSVL
jgi:glycosyltransferase involved in cell wall biosynthesis